MERFSIYGVVISMEPHKGPGCVRWSLVCLAGAFSVAAALAYLEYMGNGIAAGAIIGLPGREADVMVMQHHAVVWLGVCALFQFGVVIALSSSFRFGAETDRLVRLVSRAMVATLLSILTTFVAA
jgi:hypothetical protein